MVLQAAIQSERDRTEKLLAEAAERQREMEERTRKMMEEERARNDMQARAMYELLVVSFFCILAKTLRSVLERTRQLEKELQQLKEQAAAQESANLSSMQLMLMVLSCWLASLAVLSRKCCVPWLTI